MNGLVPKVNMFIKALSWAPAKVKFRLLIRECFVIGIFINSNIAKHFHNNFFNKTKPVIDALCKLEHQKELKWLNHTINSRPSSAWVFLFREKFQQRLYKMSLCLHQRIGLIARKYFITPTGSQPFGIFPKYRIEKGYFMH